MGVQEACRPGVHRKDNAAVLQQGQLVLQPLQLVGVLVAPHVCQGLAPCQSCPGRVHLQREHSSMPEPASIPSIAPLPAHCLSSRAAGPQQEQGKVGVACLVACIVQGQVWDWGRQERYEGYAHQAPCPLHCRNNSRPAHLLSMHASLPRSIIDKSPCYTPLADCPPGSGPWDMEWSMSLLGCQNMFLTKIYISRNLESVSTHHSPCKPLALLPQEHLHPPSHILGMKVTLH